MTDFISVHFSASHPNEAKTIGMALVKDRLAACLNVQGGVESTFWWQGEIQGSTEAIGILKTRRGLFPDICTRIKELHSYTTPMIVAMDLTDIDPDYAAWLEQETKKP